VTGPGLGFDVLRDASPEREASERALAAAGVRLPLPHRTGWALARRRITSRYVALRAPSGAYAGAFTVDAAVSRALPGYRLLRVERFGEALAGALWPAAVDALATIARQPRVLRLTVEVFSRDAAARTRLGTLLAQAGFRQVGIVRNWDRTLALDLQPAEPELLASFSQSARQGIRSVSKAPVKVCPIDDVQLGDRLEALSRETFARTGGRYRALWDWAGVIALSRLAPDAARLVGLFRTDRDGPEALLGFAWGWWNGQSASYFAGASARPRDLRVQIGQPLLWDLIVWAKRAGAAWFDLGGVSAGSARSGDPVGGISDFKRTFSKEIAEVAEDWTLEAHRVPARLAALVSSGAAWLSRMGGR
jgi:hypothetical protein